MDQLPLILSDASGVPFYRQIMDQIGQCIRSGQLRSGDQLPSVRDLAGQLLVSLITVRRSYADLEAAGLIVRRQGHGTFVAEEIAAATEEQARAETRAALEELLSRAARFGLGAEEVRGILNELLDSRSNENGK